MTGNVVIIMLETCFEMSRMYPGCIDTIIIEPSVQSRAMSMFENLPLYIDILSLCWISYTLYICTAVNLFLSESSVYVRKIFMVYSTVCSDLKLFANSCLYFLYFHTVKHNNYYHHIWTNTTCFGSFEPSSGIHTSIYRIAMSVLTM
jgi:hypothetical protein